MTDYQRFYRNEGDYPQLDGDAACQRLSAAIACRTVNDGTTDGEFARLRQHIMDSFPAVMAAADTEVVGRSLLIRIPGSDQGLKPVLFMSHMDVVGVEAGTEGDWTYPPFSGAIAGGTVEAFTTLKKGDSQTWKGTDKVTVRVGDAGAVSFSVNGKDLGTAGKTGQVANKTFTKDDN